MRLTLKHTACVFALVNSLATHAVAQGEAAEDGASRTLDTVTVTATKRETTLEDTPLAISVVSGVEIANRNIGEVQDLLTSLPNIASQQSPGDLPSLRIRGIGTNNANQVAEQSVGLFLDGVYKPRARQYRDALFDVERVEVIRGAQGVVFGKNTSVGAVSVVSRKPGDEFGGEVYASYEFENEGHRIGGAVDLPVSDMLKLRVGAELSEIGGYVDNQATNAMGPNSERSIVRGTALFEPTSAFNATLMVQHADQETVGNAFQFVEINDPFLAGIFGITAEPYVKFVDGDVTLADGSVLPEEGDEQTSTDVALTLNYQLSDNMTLTSVSSYSEMSYRNISDVFYFSSPAPGYPLGSQVFDEDFEQFTQEIRLDYQGENWSALGGVFYQDQSIGFNTDFSLVSFLPAGTLIPDGFGGFIDLDGFAFAGRGDTIFEQDLENFSGFLQLSVDLTDKFTLAGGLRVSDEDKVANLSRVRTGYSGFTPITLPNDLFLAPGLPGPRNLITVVDLLSPSGVVPEETNSDSAVDGSLNLSYDVNDDWMIYGAFAQGTKSGAFNNASTSTPVRPDPYLVAEEVAQNFEIGAKGTFANGRGFFSGAIFHMSVEDFQDSVFDETAGPVGGFVIRSFDAVSTGFEGEARFQVNDNILIHGNYAYLDAENDETGGRLAVAPESSGAFGVDTNWRVTDSWDLLAGGLVNFSDSALTRQVPPPAIAPFDPLETGSWTLTDLYLGMQSDQGMNVRLEVKNVFEEEYETFNFIQPLLGAGRVAALNAPRTVYLSARYAF